MTDTIATADAPESIDLRAATFNTTHNAVMITDVRNRILLVNPSFEKLTGYTLAEVKGKDPSVLSSGRHPTSFYAELWHSLNTTGRWSGDMLDRRKDGHVYEKELHISLVRDATGQTAYHIGIFHDITKRKRFEQSLREREELLRTLIDSTPDIVQVKDGDGRWLIANKAALELYRLAGKDWQLRSDAEIADLLDPAYAEGLRRCAATDLAAWQTDENVWRGTEEIPLPEGGNRVFDVIKKPIFGEHGERKLLTVIGRDITARVRLERDLEFRASHDPLTGLANSSLLNERLAQALKQAQQRKTMLAVCVLDLDSFKSVNDEFGHASGDLLLQLVGRRLRSVVRAEDTLARLGGDEFALVLHAIDDHDQLHEVLQRVMGTLQRPFTVDGHALSANCSIGIALYGEEHHADINPEVLLRQADQAMYDAKQQGRNGYRVFDTRRQSALQKRQAQIGRIRQALQRQELRLHYQPKVDLRRAEVIGLEALLRWEHPDKGLLGPDMILPLIEQDDLIVEIGEWVTETAIRQLATWRALGLRLPVAVNVAARQLQHPQFVQRVLELCDATPELERALLEFEIVESSVLDNFEHVRAVILQLNQQGIRFALDDFGTGYSSLAYLKRIPADTLKIDQTFVRSLLDDENDRVLVRGILGLARGFDLRVVAEGVETDAQARLLQQMGCDAVQGYGIARPMPAHMVADWCRDYALPPEWQHPQRVA